MAILSVDNLSKSYGMKTLFDAITFHIESKDRVGLVGINGTGKSTLLKILAGSVNPDGGQVTMNKQVVIQYLSQTPDFDPEATVLDQVLQGDAKAMVVVRDYELVLEKLKHDPEDTHLINRFNQLTETMGALNAFELESQVKTILTKLNLHDFEKPIGTLSGGQKKRVALAAALVAPCDILILDEPTNHMDHDVIDWLEAYLRNKSCTLLMVTHDRYFLDRVCNKIIELDQGRCFTYEGNYTTYVTKKAERLQLEGVLETRRQNLYRRELAWIRAGAQARSTKQKARIDRFKAIEAETPIIDAGLVDFSVGFTRMGKKTIVLEDVSMGFDDLLLFEHVSKIMLPNERLGIIGINGCGKSTLLNVMTKRLAPLSGHVAHGDTLNIGYFSQEPLEAATDIRAIDYIKATAEWIPTEDGMKLSASQMMEKFLFTGEQQYATLQTLSGGERRRLDLLKVLMTCPNVLILDEPTNDLDIDTLKVLENYIDSFKGIVITVSHDRYFLDRVCTHILSFEKDGVIAYTGNYEDYMGYRQTTFRASAPNPICKEKALQPKREKQIKLTYQEQKDLGEIDARIEALMTQLETLQTEQAAYHTDFEKLQTSAHAIEALEETLLEAMTYQEYLIKKQDNTLPSQ